MSAHDFAAVSFAEWKEQLLVDAEGCGRRRAVESLDDYVLCLFWREEVRPRFRALVAACETEVHELI